MTADEYFQIALPTDADFRAWTKTLLARADRINALLLEKYPHLFKVKIPDGLPL